MATNNYFILILIEYVFEFYDEDYAVSLDGVEAPKVTVVMDKPLIF